MPHPVVEAQGSDIVPWDLRDLATGDPVPGYERGLLLFYLHYALWSSFSTCDWRADSIWRKPELWKAEPRGGSWMLSTACLSKCTREGEEAARQIQ